MFNVNVDGKIDMSSNCASKEIKRKGEWVFEVRSANGRPTARTIIMPPTTYGPILNIEENLHGSRLRRFKRPFKPVFYFHNGTVTTQCRTLNLCAQRVERKGRDERIGIGSIAEVIKISIVLELGQKLVLFQPGTNPERVIWENSYNGATEGDDSAEGRILNLSYDHKNEATMREAPYDCNCETYPSEVEEPEVPEDRPATDFQLYYSLVFKKDRADRFELINPSNECKTEMYLDHKSSVPPYKCGMMLVSSEEIKYEKAQE
jgi:hypothetical protein